MTCLSLKTVGPSSSSSSPFSGTNKGSSTTTSKRRTELTLVRKNHFQVRNEMIIEQQPKSQKVVSVSRRDAMLSAGALGLGAITLFSADTAEAHIINPDIKHKFFEKFKMLREKAGLSKPKSSDKKNDKEKAKSPFAEHKHNSPASQPQTTLPKDKIPESTKKVTPPPLVHQSGTPAGLKVEATAVPK
ncbi:hypothetical protein MKX01_008488 [Papaver californicum]|nr:hypothetical protein MKX01_008488 [Papaver californicum]